MLQFLDGEPETVRLVETHAGAALATYETSSSPNKPNHSAALVTI